MGEKPTEQEPAYLSSEERFANEIETRLELWFSVIDESDLEEKTKEGIKERLNIFKASGLNNWHSPSTVWENKEDVFYFTVSTILQVTERDKNKEKAKTFFKDIAGDIWALFEEINK
jgi:hypothetical protein